MVPVAVVLASFLFCGMACPAVLAETRLPDIGTPCSDWLVNLLLVSNHCVCDSLTIISKIQSLFFGFISLLLEVNSCNASYAMLLFIHVLQYSLP